jgi:signal transduction histidine kinase
VAASLRAVPLFAELSDFDLDLLERRSEVVVLSAGDELFAEGAVGQRAFVISEGEIEIVKRTGDREVLLAVRKPGEVIGEMALLQDAPRSATAKARTDARLLAIPKAEIDVLMDSSISAVRAMFKVLLERWQATQSLLTQSERMAQLGTLTAGLAHELNNPAAAVNRAAGQLGDSVAELAAAERGLASVVGDADREAIESLRARLGEIEHSGEPMNALDRSDREDEVEDVLTDAGVDDAWRLAPAIVDAGLADLVDEVIETAGERSGELLEVLRAGHDVASLLHEVEEGTRRLSSIVRALKSYSYLDQGPVQEVDLASGLDDTLLILKTKLSGIEVERRYGDDLPRIQGFGGELNQVWTNLLDNAADAIHESKRPDGKIVIRAFPEGELVVVEVEDNGPGIRPEAIHRVFDSFFTTKPPGSGTGLGLNISYSIVVDKHRGDITVESEPGRTVFRVELPRRVTD